MEPVLEASAPQFCARQRYSLLHRRRDRVIADDQGRLRNVADHVGPCRQALACKRAIPQPVVERRMRSILKCGKIMFAAQTLRRPNASGVVRTAGMIRTPAGIRAFSGKVASGFPSENATTQERSTAPRTACDSCAPATPGSASRGRRATPGISCARQHRGRSCAGRRIVSSAWRRALSSMNSESFCPRNVAARFRIALVATDARIWMTSSLRAAASRAGGLQRLVSSNLPCPRPLSRKICSDVVNTAARRSHRYGREAKLSAPAYLNAHSQWAT